MFWVTAARQRCPDARSSLDKPANICAVKAACKASPFSTTGSAWAVSSRRHLRPVLRHAFAAEMAALHQVFHVQRNQRGLELAIGADIARGVAARIVVQKQQNVDCGLRHARFFAQRAHLSGHRRFEADAKARRIGKRSSSNGDSSPFFDLKIDILKLNIIINRFMTDVKSKTGRIQYHACRAIRSRARGAQVYCYFELTSFARKKTQTD